MSILGSSGLYWESKTVSWWVRIFSSPKCKFCYGYMKKMNSSCNPMWICRPCNWFVVHKPKKELDGEL